MSAESSPSTNQSTLAERLSRRGIHYGWVIVAVTFATMMVGACAAGAPGALIGPLRAEFGWNIAEISAAFAVRFALFGLVGPFAAVLFIQFGTRRVAAIALTVIGFGVVASLRMTSLPELLMLWGFVLGVGTGLTAMVLGATVATQWFVARRGLVMGLLSASTAAGQLVFLPAFAALMEAYGWRVALSLLLAMLLVALIATLILMRDKPSDVGLLPYGAAAPPANVSEAISLRAMLASPLIVLAEASRSGTFWILFGTFFICGATTTGLVQTHLIAFCGDFGIGSVLAAGMLAAIGAFNVVGTIGSGWLTDRFDGRWLLFWYYSLRGLSLLYLPFTEFGFYELAIFTALSGLDWLATVPPTVKLTANSFGSKATIVFGWIFAGHQLGSATAAYGAGFIRSVYETYLPAFVLAAILCFIAALAVFAVRSSRNGLSTATA